MSKSTRESACDKGGVPPVDEGPTPVAPSVWCPADRGGTLFHLQRDVLEGTIHEHVSRYQETDEAKALGLLVDRKYITVKPIDDMNESEHMALLGEEAEGAG